MISNTWSGRFSISSRILISVSAIRPARFLWPSFSIDKVGDVYIGCVPGKEQLMVVIGKGKDVVALANSTYRDV